MPASATPPQRGERLRYRECQVVAGDRTASAALGFLRLDRRDLLGTRDRSELRIEIRDALVDALLHARILPVSLTQRLARDRVAAHPDQQLELRFGDLPACGELTVPEVGQARPYPETGRCSLLRVIPRQRGREITVAIARGDGAQEVLVAVAGRHHAH